MVSVPTNDHELNSVKLTRREQEVLDEVVNGLSAKQIASKLNLSPKTVEVYVDRLRLKTHSKNRCQMVATAVRSGLTGDFLLKS